MAELLEPVNGMMCHMTESCQRMMTRAGRDKYALNHQILYTMVAEMVNNYFIVQLYFVILKDILNCTV